MTSILWILYSPTVLHSPHAQSASSTIVVCTSRPPQPVTSVTPLDAILTQPSASDAHPSSLVAQRTTILYKHVPWTATGPSGAKLSPSSAIARAACITPLADGSSQAPFSTASGPPTSALLPTPCSSAPLRPLLRTRVLAGAATQPPPALSSPPSPPPASPASSPHLTLPTQRPV